MSDDALPTPRDAGGRFGKGNPGRRPGSRNRLTNRLVQGLLDDFSSNEAANLERLRRWYFPQYVQLMARFLPRETREPRPDFGDYSAEERARVAAAVRAMLERVERGEAGLDALIGVLESDPATAEAELAALPRAEAEAARENTVDYGESTVARPTPHDSQAAVAGATAVAGARQ
jgi:hypothetical protein